MIECSVEWGNHACDREADHEGLHVCGCCPTFMAGEEMKDRLAHKAAHENATSDQYGADGCAAMWPYYGEEVMGLSAEPSSMAFHQENPVGGVVVEHMPEEFARLHQWVRDTRAKGEDITPGVHDDPQFSTGETDYMKSPTGEEWSGP